MPKWPARVTTMRVGGPWPKRKVLCPMSKMTCAGLRKSLPSKSPRPGESTTLKLMSMGVLPSTAGTVARVLEIKVPPFPNL